MSDLSKMSVEELLKMYSAPDWLEGMTEEDIANFDKAIIAELERRTVGDVPDDCIVYRGKVVKVLGTLPMTADGCVIGRGAELWINGNPDNRQWSARHILVYNDKGHYIGDADGACGPCYSTRQAALAAKGVH